MKKGSNTPHKNRKGTQNRRGHRRCKWCGKLPSHDRYHCPAIDSNAGSATNAHTSRLCAGQPKENPYISESQNVVFLGGLRIEKSLKKDPHDLWNVTLHMEGRPMNLHIDTGTEVTVITEETWKATGQPALSSVGQINLEGPRLPRPFSNVKVHRYNQVQGTRTERGDLRGEGFDQAPSWTPSH